MDKTIVADNRADSTVQLGGLLVVVAPKSERSRRSM